MLINELKLANKSERCSLVISLLDKNNTPWRSSNRGIHITVEREHYKLDIWPTTLKFRITEYPLGEGNTFSGAEEFLENLEKYLRK
jgi:hypothetical protein